MTNYESDLDLWSCWGIDNHDLCRWSCAFDRSPSHLIMCCIWSKSEYVASLVIELAAKHELAVFDPQSETINFPPNQS